MTEHKNKASMILAQKQTHKDQQYRMEDPEISPHTYSHLMFNQNTKNIHWRKNSLFNKCVGKTGCPHVEDYSYT
jgi:hypothetical protein